MLVITTHQGVYDSEAQRHPDNPRRGDPNVVVDVCTLDPSINLNQFCNAKWHTYLVALKESVGVGCTDSNGAVGLPALEVDMITWQEPSTRDFAAGKTIGMFGVDRSSDTYINSLSGDPDDETTFQLAPNLDGTLLQFNLAVAFDGNGGAHVCL